MLHNMKSACGGAGIATTITRLADAGARHWITVLRGLLVITALLIVMADWRSSGRGQNCSTRCGPSPTSR